MLVKNTPKDFHYKPRYSVFLSGILSGILLFVVYISDNYAFPFFAVTPCVTFIESLIQSPRHASVSVDTTRIFINTGYEAAFVETRHGKEKITDRAVLLQLLNDLEQKTDYREIFVDIRFEKGLVTKDDSTLVERLMAMPNTFVAKHRDYINEQDFPLIDKRLLKKAGYADYSASIFNTAFSRYEFIQHGGESAALKMYNDINHSTIKHHGWGIFSYYDDAGRLCNNAAFIRIPEDMSPGVLRYRNDNDHTFRYYNLGEDIYGTMTRDFSMQDRFFEDCKDKIIVIGDFVFDQHDTYYNKQPGPYLNYLAYSTLREGRHIVDWWLIAIAFFVYFVTIWWILCRKRGSRIRSKILKVIIKVLGFLGYTALLVVVSMVLFFLKGKVLSIFIPSLFFSIIDIFLPKQK